MAKEKTYLNILDQMLDSGMDSAEMDDAAKRGDDLSALTQDMAEDGSFAKHVSASIETGRTIIAKKLSDDNILNDVVISENKAKSNKDGLQSAANDAQVLSAIDKLLKRGHSPARILAALKAKRAELNLQDRTFNMSADYLNRSANTLGMNHLKPNTYMPNQPTTYESQKPDLKHASVHVAQEGEDLLGLMESKFGGQASVQKRAIEVKIADTVEPKANVSTIGRVPNPLIHRGAQDATKTAAVYHRGSEFDAGVVGELHTAGKTFEEIWRTACERAGLHLASKAFHEYVNRAKQSGQKFASSDANFLSSKLGFRDLEIAVPKPVIARTAYDSGKMGGTAKDGNALMQEFELAPAKPIEIEIKETEAFDIELGNSEINL